MKKMRKVLLVDDEESMRALVAATFKLDGRYQLLQAGSGVEALSLVQKEKPELILLDVRMPVMDGFEVCRQLKTNPDTRDISVIMLTAMTQDTDKKRGREVGADDFFTKPFSPKSLLAKVTEVFASRPAL